jgi:UDP-N-acetylglucosamine transferase subunit ALG13
MRIITLSSGTRSLISNEEALLLDLIKNQGGSMYKKHMDERQQQVAVNLTQRSVLTRVRSQGKLMYQLCEPHIWRI